MGIKKYLKGLVTKSPKMNYVGGTSWGMPPDANTSMLGAYNQVATLYAIVSRIAIGVAESRWRLFEVSKTGKRKEIPTHPLLDLLKYVNPFQTGFELFEWGQIFQELAGRNYWVMNYNKGGTPAELWIAEPNKMKPIPDPKKFISGFEYTSGTEKQILSTDEVIFFYTPDPTNAYGGSSAARSAATDIAVTKYARLFQQRFFFNNAEPTGIITLPDLDEDDLKKFEAEWNKKHKGWFNSNKLAMVNTEVDYKRTGATHKEMEFWRADKGNRDALVFAFGMPLSVMGVSENVNRANAEAGEFLFTRWVVRPRLVRIREKLNEQLAPRFGKGLELDFDEPVPETDELRLRKSEAGVKSGFLTVNEARQTMGYDAVPSGNVFLMPLNVVPQPLSGGFSPSPPPEEEPEAEEPKGLTYKSLFKEEKDKESFWKAYADKAEGYEEKLIPRLREMFGKQEKQVLSKLSPGMDVNNLLDQDKKLYKESATPVLAEQMVEAIDNGADLVKPTNPHKAAPDYELGDDAAKWLDERVAWAAAEVGEETARLLSSTLVIGIDAGESMKELGKRVELVFDNCDKARALKIARTETIAVSNEGALLGYADSGVVEKAEFYAALDERVCPDCNALHGKVYKLSEAHGVIPVHPNCRCVMLPVV